MSDAMHVASEAGILDSLDDDSDDAIGIDDVDGRTMRRRRNRDAVIDALISLIREGDLEPNVAKIADRAEVSHRSIFRYFDDLNDLARTAIESEFRHAWHLSIIPDLGEGTFDHRLDQFVTIQMRSLQRLHSLGRVARSKAIAIPEIDRGLATVLEFRLDQARRQFAPELAAMAEELREPAIVAVTILAGADSFDVQRRMLGASMEEVRRTWSNGVRKLLT
jgi:TetR/AcrR family transcriptional regulator, regulator of autoinduction and epiphytic fitness